MNSPDRWRSRRSAAAAGESGTESLIEFISQTGATKRGGSSPASALSELPCSHVQCGSGYRLREEM